MELPTPGASASDGPDTMRRWGLPLGVIVLGFFMSILDVTIVNVAVPAIQHEFGGSLEDVLWIATSYTLTLGVVVPLSGWLGEQIGLTRLYIVALVGFAGASGLCGLAWDLNSLIAARIVQAVPGGILPVTTLTLLYRLVPAKRVGVAMGIYGFGAMAAPAVGPVLGGYFVDYVSWRLVFDINVPVGLLTAAGAWVVLPRMGTCTPPRFDRWGFGTVALGLFAILLAASKGDSWGWDSYRIQILTVFGVLIVALFVIIELEREHPLLDVRLLTNGQFLATLFVTTIGFVNLLVGTFYLPVFLQHGQGYTGFASGELILPQALVMLMTIPLSGVLYGRYGPRVLGGVGFGLVVLGDLLFCAMTPDMTRAQVIAWTCIRGAGIGIGVMPIMTWGISRVPASRNPQANALFNVAQQVGGALGLAALGTFITARQADLMAARTDLLGPDSELAHRFGPTVPPDLTSDPATFALLYRLGQRLQLDVLAVTYRQMFFVLALLTAAAGLLTLALRETASRPPVPAIPTMVEVEVEVEVEIEVEVADAVPEPAAVGVRSDTPLGRLASVGPPDPDAPPVAQLPSARQRSLVT